MTRANSVAAILLVAIAGAATWDLMLIERDTIVVYTTPALRDLLERDLVPAFRARTGHDVALVYVPAGQQYNRLRMSGDRPEADLFLHASPLYLEKAYASGHIEPAEIRDVEAVPAHLASRVVDDKHIWLAFAWSPLVEVHGPGLPAAPDLATSDAVFGFPHPVLSNNGIYAVLLFESAGIEAGRRALRHTRVQPVNARANIGGAADGSFQLTLGYEAVVRFFQRQGASVSYEVPLLAGQRVTTAALFSVALVRGRRHARAEELARFLFTREAQGMLAKHHFRSVHPRFDTPPDLLDLAAAAPRMIDYDWSRWADLEQALPRYEVK
jgi:ABC-type molybdate transport system substrate-binding protein